MLKICNKKGFTLVELLMALAIVGMIAGFTIGIAASVRNLGKTGETERRMKIIAEKTVKFYRGKQEIPRPIVSTTGNLVAVPTNASSVHGNVPVGVSYLDLEQKYRLDAWGQYFRFVMSLSPQIIFNGGAAPEGFLFPPATGAYHDDSTNISSTNIIGIEYETSSGVGGRRVAGLIISGGPNQIIDSIPSSTPTSGDPVTYTLVGDDIIVPIDVTQVAVQIAIEELELLQSKVKAFDSIFEGIDNDGNGDIDEDGAVEYGECSGTPFPTPCTTAISYPDCPDVIYTSGSDNGTDPNSGRITLDVVSAGAYNPCNGGNCEDSFDQPTSVFTSDPLDDDGTVNSFIYCLYGLSDNYMVDPWLNLYIWGGGTDANPFDLNNTTSDKRYHKFFSRGPDLITDTDDSQSAVDDDIVP